MKCWCLQLPKELKGVFLNRQNRERINCEPCWLKLWMRAVFCWFKALFSFSLSHRFPLWSLTDWAIGHWRGRGLRLFPGTASHCDGSLLSAVTAEINKDQAGGPEKRTRTCWAFLIFAWVAVKSERNRQPRASASVPLRSLPCSAGFISLSHPDDNSETSASVLLHSSLPSSALGPCGAWHRRPSHRQMEPTLTPLLACRDAKRIWRQEEEEEEQEGEGGGGGVGGVGVHACMLGRREQCCLVAMVMLCLASCEVLSAQPKALGWTQTQ